MRKLERKHIKTLSLILTRIFGIDDLKEIFPDPEERRVKTPYFHEFYLLYGFSDSESFITSPNLEGIAVWIHSDKWKRKSFWRILTSDAIWPAIKIGIRAIRKMQKLDSYMDEKHRELAPDKHWYLSLLAVDPEQQGKGYASKLLNEMLAQIDEEGLPCYLETEGKKNVFIYKHFGFEVVDEFVVPETNDKIIAMLREPKTLSE